MVDGNTSEPKDRCPHAKRAFNAEAQIVQLACDQWACSHCGKVLAWRWADRVRYGIALRLDREPWFWTITLPAWVPDAAVGYKILPSRWAALRQTLLRADPHFLYAAFVEGHPHRSFIPHLHLITFGPGPTRLKDLAHHAGFGYQAKEQEINGTIAVSYVSKYVSKQGAGMPRNFRRVRISHGWPRLPPPLYELPVYPLKRGEALSQYLLRMSVTLGRPLDVLRDVYLDHTRDIY